MWISVIMISTIYSRTQIQTSSDKFQLIIEDHIKTISVSSCYICVSMRNWISIIEICIPKSRHWSFAINWNKWTLSIPVIINSNQLKYVSISMMIGEAINFFLWTKSTNQIFASLWCLRNTNQLLVHIHYEFDSFQCLQ